MVSDTGLNSDTRLDYEPQDNKKTTTILHFNDTFDLPLRPF